MGVIPMNNTPPPDNTLSRAGVAADASAVNSKFSNIVQSKIIGQNDKVSTFYISTSDDTTTQYYRKYFLIKMLDQSGGLFEATLVWRGYAGNISWTTVQGSGTITHSNGTITVTNYSGGWGNTFIFWDSPSIKLQ